MRVLVACEFSGIVREAFNSLAGVHAVSCDLLPAEDGRSDYHHQGDVREILGDGWDMLIAFPDCTYLCSSGLHWNNRGRGWEETEKALDFVHCLMAAPIKRKAIENPVGLISTRIKPASQYIQPNWFGHDASKKTGLWLDRLPLLVPTQKIPGRIVEWPKGSGRFRERWANQTDSGQNKLAPSDDRWKDRARTYPGIAMAMAEQWGRLL